MAPRDLTSLSSVRRRSGGYLHAQMPFALALLPPPPPNPPTPTPFLQHASAVRKVTPSTWIKLCAGRSGGVRSHAGWQVSLFRRSLSPSVAEAQVWRDGRYFRWWRDKSDHFWSEEESTEGAFLLILLWDVNGSVALKEEQVSDAKRVSVRVHEFQPLTVGAPHMGKHQCIP